jgi:hypothetical protein
MVHVFYLNVAKVDLVLHILQWLYTYIASVCLKCFTACSLEIISQISQPASSVFLSQKTSQQYIQPARSAQANKLSVVSGVCGNCFI